MHPEFSIEGYAIETNIVRLYYLLNTSEFKTENKTYFATALLLDRYTDRQIDR